MPSRLKLRPRSTPPTPPTDAETLFLDEADGALKSIDSDGVVTAIGAGGGAAEPGTVVVQLVGTQTTYVKHFFGDADPALSETVAAGDMWTDTSLGTGQWFDWQRNADNDTWVVAARPLAQVLQAGNSAGDQPIAELLDPTPGNPQQAATKNYVDTKGPVVVSDDDPGAIGAGHIWVDMGSANHLWKRRNATDDGWDPPFLQYNVDGTIILSDVLGGEALTIDPDGTIKLGGDKLVLAPDGTITLGADFLTLNPDFTWLLNGAHALAGDADGVKIDGNLVGTRAAFVANGSTVDQLRDALIASGLMAAS